MGKMRACGVACMCGLLLWQKGKCANANTIANSNTTLSLILILALSLTLTLNYRPAFYHLLCTRARVQCNMVNFANKTSLLEFAMVLTHKQAVCNKYSNKSNRWRLSLNEQHHYIYLRKWKICIINCRSNKHAELRQNVKCIINCKITTKSQTQNVA